MKGTKMKFDLVSDLHIDMWDKQFHFDWLNEQKSDTLVIAGDISDHIDMSCEYVVKMQEYYKTVMVIDGNHEHQPRFPSVEESTNDYKVAIRQTGAHYLGDRHFQQDDIRFIGVNGWWSFDFGDPNVPFDTCVNAFLAKTSWGRPAVKEQFRQGVKDCQFLLNQMLDAQEDDTVSKIVVVTHPLPHPSCISWNVYPDDNNFTGLYGNSKFQWTLDADRKGKLKYWLFGHNHDHKDIPYKGARLISNPRGRPKDWNREVYSPRQLEVGHDF